MGASGLVVNGEGAVLVFSETPRPRAGIERKLIERVRGLLEHASTNLYDLMIGLAEKPLSGAPCSGRRAVTRCGRADPRDQPQHAQEEAETDLGGLEG